MKDYYKIGEISKLYNIGTDSLRYYEEIGILKPRRDSNGYRMYGINDIRTLNILRELRSIGFSMDEIKNHLESFNLQKTKDMFESAIDAIDFKILELNALKSQLQERITEIDYHTRDNIKYGVPAIEELPERHILKLSENIIREDDLDFIIKKLQSENEDQLYIIGNGDIGSTIALDYLQDGNYGLYDSAFYIVESNEKFDESLTSGKYITMTIKGAYPKVPLAWAELFDFAREHELEPLAPAIEIYVIDNHDTGDENEYITQLQVAIR